MKTIYLIGALSEDPATHQWRDEVILLLSDEFNIINPAASIFDKELLKKSKEDPEEFYKWVKRKDSELLLPKSYLAVEQSDILFTNLAIEPVGRPIIGTICELSWGWALHKAIVAIRGDNCYGKYPMIIKMVHAFVDSVQEGCRVIKEFFA